MHECIHAWPLIPKVLLLCLIHALIRSLARSLTHSLTRYLSCLLAGLVVRAVCSHFLENADFPNGGMADWGTGMGQLEVYLDDLVSPVLVTPLNLGGLLHLYHGRAWVGFTGATGLSTWQTQVGQLANRSVIATVVRIPALCLTLPPSLPARADH